MQVLEKIIPIFVFLLIGYFFKVKKFISEKTLEELKKFIINITLPALLFNAFLYFKYLISGNGNNHYSFYLIVFILPNFFINN